MVKADYWMPRAVFNYYVENDMPESYEDYNWDTLCSKYAIGDVHRTIGLYFFLQEILQRDGLQEQYERELRLLPVTYNMEHVGMHVHQDKVDSTMEDFRTQAEEKKAKAEKIFCGLTGDKEINVNSGQQLTEALNKCGLRIAHVTKKSRKPSTEAKHLRELAQYCEYHPTDTHTLIASAPP
jgi:DNA polymerase I-like protein with 3'-5' exonuclease and polymerase domains